MAIKNGKLLGKLGDFGISAVLNTNVIGGTQQFMAPEIIKKSSRGQKILAHESMDVYSYGCLAHELMFKTEPFNYGNDHILELVGNG